MSYIPCIQTIRTGYVQVTVTHTYELVHKVHTCIHDTHTHTHRPYSLSVILTHTQHITEYTYNTHHTQHTTHTTHTTHTAQHTQPDCLFMSQYAAAQAV